MFATTKRYRTINKRTSKLTKEKIIFNAISEELIIEINSLAKEAIGEFVLVGVDDKILEQGILDSPAIIKLILLKINQMKKYYQLQKILTINLIIFLKSKMKLKNRNSKLKEFKILFKIGLLY